MAVEDCYGGQLRCTAERIKKEGGERMRRDSYGGKPEKDCFHENLSLNIVVGRTMLFDDFGASVTTGFLSCRLQ